MKRSRWGLLLGALALVGSPVLAQDDPFADEPEGSEPSATPPADAVPPEDEAPTAAPEPTSEEAPSEPAPELEAEAAAAAQADASVSLDATSSAPVDSTPAPVVVVERRPTLLTGSHIDRPRLVVDGAVLINSPLRTEVQGDEMLQMRRQLGGAAVPDTTAALGQGGAGTSRLELRLQPTLILLNGRRLPNAPFFGPSGTDYVDINQLPIPLIERAEITSGLAAGLYGEGAMGGVANFVTRRDIEGIDVILGAQSTDKFDQGEGDVTVLLGTGKGKSGANLMLSYFNRQPLAATDRDWIRNRTDRVESLLGSPATFQQLSNFDYPIADPYCPVATEAGHATGYEVRLRGYGPPSNLDQLPADVKERLLTVYDGSRGVPADQNDGDIDPKQAPTYCAVDYTKNNDLILKDERFHAFTTFWHALSDHTEAYGEAGYYRSENENRAAPAFPIIRTTDVIPKDSLLWVPREHPDQPVQSYGFASRGTGMGAAANELFIVGRTQGTFNGDGLQERRIDALHGALGLRGDLAGVAPNSVLSSWDWDFGGTYGTSELLSRVNDTLIDNLRTALNSCPATKQDPDTLMQVPTTIKDRQNAGCFNPFYSSVINSAALDPLNVSSASAQASAAGFITSDTDTPDSKFGYGLQDGGYICDPAAGIPCPDLNRDFDGDGVVDPFPAGQPNTQQVIDYITGEHYEYQRRALATVDASLQGKIVDFGSGALAFGAGAQYRRESLLIDYDDDYNQYEYAFLFGGDDLDPVNRDVVAGNLEMRLSLFEGLLEVQPAARVEAYDTVGVGLNGLLGLAIRPFASSGTEALEYLGLRGHVGYGMQPPTLTQLYGQVNEFAQVDYRGATAFLPHQVLGNRDLDFEKYMTISAGPMYDWAGIHVAADFWMTFINDVISYDNTRTLVNDCQAQFASGTSEKCPELNFLLNTDTLASVSSRFDNLADVDTNGIDGTISYTLDSKRRGLGDFGTFVVAAQGTYINSYLIKSPRALAAYYRDGAPAMANPENFSAGSYLGPDYNPDGTRSYDSLTAEYEAAGYRNYENFAPPIPKLRFSVPVRWMISGHTIGGTVRYLDGYYDDSEYTIEKQNLPGINQIQFYNGEKIPASVLFDLMYGFAFDADAWSGSFAVGVTNLLDTAPPAAESPLGYEVGLYDPRGRTLYARLEGDF